MAVSFRPQEVRDKEIWLRRRPHVPARPRSAQAPFRGASRASPRRRESIGPVGAGRSARRLSSLDASADPPSLARVRRYLMTTATDTASQSSRSSRPRSRSEGERAPARAAALGARHQRLRRQRRPGRRRRHADRARARRGGSRRRPARGALPRPRRARRLHGRRRGGRRAAGHGRLRARSRDPPRSASRRRTARSSSPSAAAAASRSGSRPGEAMRDFFEPYNAKDYAGALEVARGVLHTYPGNGLALYNIACMEALLGQRGRCARASRRGDRGRSGPAREREDGRGLRLAARRRALRELIAN